MGTGGLGCVRSDTEMRPQRKTTPEPEDRALRPVHNDPAPHIDPARLGIAEFAKRWSISVSLVKKHIRLGILPASRVGRRVIIALADEPKYEGALRELDEQRRSQRAAAPAKS
jgi:hypothetical protein